MLAVPRQVSPWQAQWYLRLSIRNIIFANTALTRLNSAFRSMALNLQDKADAVFQRESAHKDRVPPYSRRKPPVGLASNLPQGMYNFCGGHRMHRDSRFISCATPAGKKVKPPVALRSLRDLLGGEVMDRQSKLWGDMPRWHRSAGYLSPDTCTIQLHTESVCTKTDGKIMSWEKRQSSVFKDGKP